MRTLRAVKFMVFFLFIGMGVSFAANGAEASAAKKNKKTKNAFLEINQSTIRVSGTVIDGTFNEPLTGVNIQEKGNLSNGAVTDIDGNYSISVSANATLIFTYVGHERQEIKVTGGTLNVTMREDVNLVDEVVVTAFSGSQKKATVTGSVQTIRPDDLKVPQSRLSSSFAGRLAGVVAVQRSGQPGADGADFWIRGVATFNDAAGAKSPLVILDGVEVSVGDLNNIDPEVIDGFSILKDASATALYGTRGANGVMIVTTKTGADLAKPIINTRIEVGLTTPTYRPQLTDGVTYMNLYNQSITGRGTSDALYTQAQIKGTAAGWDPLLYPNVNWYEELFNNYAMQQKAVVNIRGGGAKLNYFMSVSIGHESGMMKDRSTEFFSFNNNINLMRYNFQNNISLNLSPTTTLALRLNTQLYDYTGPNNDVSTIFGRVMDANPVDFPVLFPSDDERNTTGETYDYVSWGGKTGGKLNDGFRNPMAEMTNGYKSQFESTVIANLDFTQKLDFITEGLSFKALASFKNWTRSTVNRSTPYNQFYISSYQLDNNGQLTDYKLTMQGKDQSPVLTTSGSSTGDRRIYLQALVDWNRSFNQTHNMGAMIVYNQDQYDVNSPTDLLTSLPQRKQGFAGRVTYDYLGKYLAEFNIGATGSENFAKGERWGFFPAFSIGWRPSEENFWSPIKDVITDLKFRASWGLVGNDKTDSRFVYLSQVNLSGKSYTTGRNMGYTLSGPTYERYENKKVTWEVGEKLNAGVDLELFGDLRVVFDIFKEDRRKIFLPRQTIPNFMGTAETKIYGNLGEVENKGFDFSVDYHKNISRDLFISVKGTFTYAANKYVNYDEPDFLLYPNKSRVGHSISQMHMYMADRLFIDQDEINNSADQKLGGFIPAAGDIKYIDQPNNKGVYDNNIDDNDRVYHGFPEIPEIVYGFGPSISWKRWDFSFFFQGVARTSLMMKNFHPFGSQEIRNVFQFIVDDHWSEYNQNPYAAYPRLSKTDNGNNTVASSYWLRSGAFLKLKNVEIGYTYKDLRVYLSGANLLTFSEFKHWDPEMGGGAGLSYPTQRIFNLGVQFTIK